jgi:hypothetical protein
MDPNKAWQALSEEFEGEQTDWQALGEVAEALLTWLKRDGFPPKITGNAAFDKLIALRACEALVDWNVCV